MLKRMLALALPVALCAAVVAVAAGGPEKHSGVITSVDASAKTITVKVDVHGSHENHIIKIVDGTTVIKDETGKAITFADLKDSMHISYTVKKENGEERVAQTINVKPAKAAKKK